MLNANPKSNQSQIDLIQIAKIVWKKRKLFSAFVIIPYLLSITAIYFIPKNYVCEAVIKVLPKHDYDPLPFFKENNDFTENEHESSAAKIIIGSSSFLSLVVKELELQKKYGIHDINEESSLSHTIQKLKSRISIKDLQSNNMLSIKISENDRELTFNICNSILNNLQKIKSNEINNKNKLILSQLNKAIKEKKIAIDSIESKLSVLRTKYKIIPLSENNNNTLVLNSPKELGFYSYFDKVISYENRLKELNNNLVKDIDKYHILNSIKDSNYPVFELLSPPYMPVSSTNYNSLLIHILILFIIIIISTSIIVLMEPNKKSVDN